MRNIWNVRVPKVRSMQTMLIAEVPHGRFVYDMIVNKSQRWRDRYLRAEILPPGWKMGVSRLGRIPIFEPLVIERVEREVPVPERQMRAATRGPRYQATDLCDDSLDQRTLGLSPELADLFHRQQGQGGVEPILRERFDDYPREHSRPRDENDYAIEHLIRRGWQPIRLPEDELEGPYSPSFAPAHHDLDHIHYNPHVRRNPHPQHMHDYIRHPPPRRAEDLVRVPERRRHHHHNHVHYQHHHHQHNLPDHSHPEVRPHRHQHVHFEEDFDDNWEYKHPFERCRSPYRFSVEELEHPYDEVYDDDDDDVGGDIDLHPRYLPHERLLMGPRARRVRGIPWWESDDD